MWEEVWAIDGRASIGALPWSDRQKRTVAIYGRTANDYFMSRWPDYNFQCSGAVIGDSDKVLTAAHCLSYPSDANDFKKDFIEVFPGQLRVCTFGNKYDDSDTICTNVTDVITPEFGFLRNAKHPAKWDLGLIATAIDLSQEVGGFNLSSDPPAVVESATIHNNAYPTYTPLLNSPCGIGSLNVAQVGVKDTLLNAVQQYRQIGNVVEATPRTVKTRLDVIQGMSGSPVYKCVGAACGQETGAIVSVVAKVVSFSQGDDVVVGPSIPGRRPWINPKL